MRDLLFLYISILNDDDFKIGETDAADATRCNTMWFNFLAVTTEKGVANYDY
jgi:hypothetical protein